MRSADTVKTREWRNNLSFFVKTDREILNYLNKYAKIRTGYRNFGIFIGGNV